MRSAEPNGLMLLAASGGALGLGAALMGIGDARVALLTGAAALLAGVLRHPLLGIVCMGVVSPLIATGLVAPGGSTFLYWPLLVAPLLLPSVLIAVLLKRDRLGALGLWLLALLTIGLVSLVRQPRTAEAPYAWGILLIVALAALAPAVTQLRARDAARYARLLWIVVLGESALVTISFCLSGSPLVRYPHYTSTLTHGFLAAFLVVGIALGTSELWSQSLRRRIWAAAGLLLVGFALLLSSSRAGIAGGFAAFGVTALLTRPRLLWVPATLLLAIAGGIIASGVNAHPWLERMLYLSCQAEITETMTRVHLTQQAWAIFREYPVFGAGPGGFGTLAHFVNYLGQPIHSAHNNYLQIAAELGAAGLAAFLLLLATAARQCLKLARAARRSDRRLGAAVAGALAGVALMSIAGDFMIPTITNDGLNGTRAAVVLWSLLGVAASRARQTTRGAAAGNAP